MKKEVKQDDIETIEEGNKVTFKGRRHLNDFEQDVIIKSVLLDGIENYKKWIIITAVKINTNEFRYILAEQTKDELGEWQWCYFKLYPYQGGAIAEQGSLYIKES